MARTPKADAARVDGRIERGRTTRELLIATAREHFGVGGYERTSIGAVLASAGVARGALYHHFESKEALFDAVLNDMVSEIATTAGAAALKAPSAVGALRAGCYAWLDAALDPSVQQIALIDARGVLGWERCREIDEQHILGGLVATLQLLAEDGRLEGADLQLLAQMILSSVNEAALMIARATHPRRANRTGKATVDLVVSRLTGATA